MARSPRLQVAGGIYHVTARGNRRQPIFGDAEDHLRFLWLLDALAVRRGWLGYAYCLMPNHYHLVFETPKADLSAGMHWLNFRYAQAFNDRHGVDGHLFQDRFYSVQVEGDWHLLELFRYLALNPVAARLCRYPGEWVWSSYGSVAGAGRARRFLAPGRVLGLFGRDPRRARARFREFVNDPIARPQG
jgi:REP element-mobilizing transposase RayT